MPSSNPSIKPQAQREWNRPAEESNGMKIKHSTLQNCGNLDWSDIDLSAKDTKFYIRSYLEQSSGKKKNKYKILGQKHLFNGKQYTMPSYRGLGSKIEV